jgi:7-keto-8-aminopelargonate synthetase-like enzyme
MAYSNKARNFYSREIKGIREAGLYKEERYIESPQAPNIKVEFPKGAPAKDVINFCANNYLGLSSHPEVVAAATFWAWNAPVCFLPAWKPTPACSKPSSTRKTP